MHCDSRISSAQRLRAPASALLLAAFALLAACGGSSVAPSSTVLLATAATNLGNDTAFHFIMQEDHPGAPSASQYDIRTAAGDVVKPDKMSATATLAAGSLGSVNTSVIVVGSHAWYKNPLTGQYESADNYADIGTFFEAGLAAALAGGLQNVSAPTDGSANGVACWKMTATVSSDQLSGLTGGQVPGGQQIPVTLCVGKDDGQLHEVAVNGKLTTFDADQTVRTIILSNFNESVTITPPAGS